MFSEVFVNTREDGTGDWIACETGAPAGYNRCYLQLSTGEFVIAGTEGSGFAGQGNKIFVKVMDPDEVFKAVPTFDSISVTGPDTTEYDLGDELDLTGLVVMANYSDGSSREISSDAYTVSGYDPNTAGEQTVTVTYGGKTAAFTVTVEEGRQPADPGQKPSDSQKPSGGQDGDQTDKAVQTGDTTNLFLPAAGMLMAAALLFVAWKKRRTEK